MFYAVDIQYEYGEYVVSFPDIPEAISSGDTLEEAKQEALDALVTAFEFYFEDQRAIPMPQQYEGLEHVVEVPLSVWAKVLTLNTMVEQRMTQTDLAHAMGTRKQEIQRIISLEHTTKIDTLAAAMAAMGKHFSLGIAQ
ncbi:type II toxin-antitoxin system HicB family antitoxin [Vibrio fluvialis]|uniref:type II toxin-antitoxin system HicB family antitoxin n=1 Tax=Vibrio fluvialis TaxID=676 RepID=UPI001EEBABE4|nr:type II toxin-antitoxin system HicB family antitoxin [Vibrio fluvialis]MCG6407789.1 type II toxin-antitoxin system HicB family antitoxin [Vibrio fluvialis]